MEQKFGKNSIDIEALREFCECEGKEVVYRKGEQFEREGDPASKKSRIVAAFERAKAIHEAKKTNGAESRESVTTIYELLFELGVIEKGKNGYVLYRK